MKEKGLYFNTNKVEEYNAKGAHVGADSTFVTKQQRVVFQRAGTWKYYNRAGRVTKAIRHKKAGLIRFKE